jgi:cell wall-associated NlpC family hydrolase
LQKIFSLKKIIPLLLLVFLGSCKPTSTIITSKKEAQEKGIYSLPQPKKWIVRNTEQKSVPKKITKKSRLNENNDDDYVASDEDTSYLVKQLINTASDNLGANYKAGGTTPAGFDCSGLMYATFKKFDIILPRSSVDMAKIGRVLNPNEIQKGDLIFFKTNGRNSINHVGMVIEVTPDEIKFIHSSTQKGVIVSSTKEPYYEKTFIQANRIL